MRRTDHGDVVPQLSQLCMTRVPYFHWAHREGHFLSLRSRCCAQAFEGGSGSTRKT